MEVTYSERVSVGQGVTPSPEAKGVNPSPGAKGWLEGASVVAEAANAVTGSTVPLDDHQ